MNYKQRLDELMASGKTYKEAAKVAKAEIKAAKIAKATDKLAKAEARIAGWSPLAIDVYGRKFCAEIKVAKARLAKANGNCQACWLPKGVCTCNS